MSAPEVQMPGRDVMIPAPRPPMITLQQLGQPWKNRNTNTNTHRHNIKKWK